MLSATRPHSGQVDRSVRVTPDDGEAQQRLLFELLQHALDVIRAVHLNHLVLGRDGLSRGGAADALPVPRLDSPSWYDALHMEHVLVLVEVDVEPDLHPAREAQREAEDARAAFAKRGL